MIDGRWRMRRTTRRQLVAGGMTVLAPLGLGALWPVRYLGRLYPGVTVLDLDLGGLTRAEAAARINEHLAPFLARPITFRFRERTWTPAAADLGIRIDLQTTLERACQQGRGVGFLKRYATLLDPDGSETGVSATIEVVDDVLRAYLASLDEEISEKPRDARLVMTRGSVDIVSDRAGRRLDLAVTREAVLAAVATLAPAEIEVTTQPVAPAVPARALEPHRRTAATLIGEPVTVTLGDRQWSVSTAELAGALVLPEDAASPPSLDRTVLAEALAPIADEVNHPPKDATVAWDGGIVATSESYDGAEVDLPRLAGDVAGAALTEERSVELPLIYTPPTVDAGNLGALGITRRLAVGSSSFAGSSEARATNVRVAAEYVSHALISPGGTFSFNDVLGPITPDRGYVQGKVISGNWFADDLGGGVCQVSTTVFRAALLAGLPFVEWHPHTFRLGFYELDGWPPGMDAAIYQPNTPDEWELDLVFANPTDAWMLLQMRSDAETVQAELYGPETAYEVAVSDPVMSDPIPPPEPVERVTADLAPGVAEQVQGAQSGIEVVVTRVVRRAGEVILDETFVSAYEPLPEIWMVGETGG